MKKYPIEMKNKIVSLEGLNSIIDFYRTIATTECQFPEAIAFATGVNSPFLNVLFDLRLNKTSSSKLSEAVTSFFNEYQVPWGWYITPADNKNDLLQLEFALVEEAPAMYFDLLNPLPAMKSEFITVQELSDTDDLTSWIQPINEGFKAAEGDDTYRQLNANILRKAHGRLRHFVAYYKDQLATAGTLFMSGNAVMIHNVATKSNFLKCGLGTTLTLHMMQEAKDSGFQHCFLDSSSEAFQLYKKIGFQVYATTLIYSKA
jgi:N-acetylglutamate synthase-like GNAT family acetyltransferase